MTIIQVVDTETTGVKNNNNEHDIVEIAICEVDTDEFRIKKRLDTVVGYDLRTRKWARRYLRSNNRNHLPWIFNNSTLTIDEVKNAPDVQEVVTKVRGILENQFVTSYNYRFDFGHYLRKDPWYINNDHLRPGTSIHRLYKNNRIDDDKILDFRIAPCLMEKATVACDLPHNYYSRKFPTLDEALYTLNADQLEYKIDRDLFNLINDPKHRHRALFDTVQASIVLLSMVKDGMYPTDSLEMTR